MADIQITRNTQISFTIIDEKGNPFADAIYVPEREVIDNIAIATEIQTRYNNWQDTVNTAGPIEAGDVIDALEGS